MARAGIIGLACLLAMTPALGAETSAEAIGAALEGWRVGFNAGRAGQVCDLFAPELRYDFQGLPEQNFQQLCDRLHAALASTERHFHYELRIREVIVSGDLAVARIVWTSTMTTPGTSVTQDEPGLDVFRRQPDGAWRIIRYIAYPEPPS